MSSFGGQNDTCMANLDDQVAKMKKYKFSKSRMYHFKFFTSVEVFSLSHALNVLEECTYIMWTPDM